MIVEHREDLLGQTYTVMIPETEADLKEIRRLEKARRIDARESFGDEGEIVGKVVED